MHLFQRTALSLISCVALAPAFAADEPDKSGSPCVFVSQIDHFQYVDDKTAILETSPSKRFKVTFFNTCRELRWAVFARVEARPGICLSKGDKIVIGRTHSMEERCIIDSIESMPPRIPKSAAAPPE